MYSSAKTNFPELPKSILTISLLLAALLIAVILLLTEFVDEGNYFYAKIILGILLALPFERGVVELYLFVKTRKYETVRMLEIGKQPVSNFRFEYHKTKNEQLRNFQKSVLRTESFAQKHHKPLNSRRRLNLQLPDQQISDHMNRLLNKNQRSEEQDEDQWEISEFNVIGGHKGGQVMHYIKMLMSSLQREPEGNAGASLRVFHHRWANTINRNYGNSSSRNRGKVTYDQPLRLPSDLPYKIQPEKIADALEIMKDHLMIILETEVYHSISQNLSDLGIVVRKVFDMEVSTQISSNSEASIEQLRDIVKIFRNENVLPEKYRRKSHSASNQSISLAIDQIQRILERIPDISESPAQLKLTLYSLALSLDLPKYKILIQNPYNQLSKIECGEFHYNARESSIKNNKIGAWHSFYVFSDQQISYEKYKSNFRVSNVELMILAMLLDGIKQNFSSKNSLIRNLRNLIK